MCCFGIVSSYCCTTVALYFWLYKWTVELNRSDFQVDARILRRGLLDNGYIKLPILSEHAVAIDALAPIHKDPFDRLLIAQATVEGITFLTNDADLANYRGQVRLV